MSPPGTPQGAEHEHPRGTGTYDFPQRLTTREAAEKERRRLSVSVHAASRRGDTRAVKHLGKRLGKIQTYMQQMGWR